jgi:hypothetical protein
MARIRSPNYPAFSLPTAIDRARSIHAAEGKNAAPREAMAKHIGFGSLNGASASALSAIAKYGLIEGANDGETRLTDLAMRILYPHSEEEKKAALEEAAFKPALFSEIHEKWPDRAPSDESLRSFLVRKGFSQGALDQVIQFYRETIEVASSTRSLHDSPSIYATREVHTPSMEVTPKPAREVPPPVPLSTKPFTVVFDGTVLTGTMALRTVRDIDRLIKVLTAQKAAIVAMQDDDSSPNPDDQYDLMRGRDADEDPFK